MREYNRQQAIMELKRAVALETPSKEERHRTYEEYYVENQKASRLTDIYGDDSILRFRTKYPASCIIPDLIKKLRGNSEPLCRQAANELEVKYSDLISKVYDKSDSEVYEFIKTATDIEHMLTHYVPTQPMYILRIAETIKHM